MINRETTLAQISAILFNYGQTDNGSLPIDPDIFVSDDFQQLLVTEMGIVDGDLPFAEPPATIDALAEMIWFFATDSGTKKLITNQFVDMVKEWCGPGTYNFDIITLNDIRNDYIDVTNRDDFNGEFMEMVGYYLGNTKVSKTETLDPATADFDFGRGTINDVVNLIMANANRMDDGSFAFWYRSEEEENEGLPDNVLVSAMMPGGLQGRTFVGKYNQSEDLGRAILDFMREGAMAITLVPHYKPEVEESDLSRELFAEGEALEAQD